MPYYLSINSITKNTVANKKFGWMHQWYFSTCRHDEKWCEKGMLTPHFLKNLFNMISSLSQNGGGTMAVVDVLSLLDKSIKCINNISPCLFHDEFGNKENVMNLTHFSPFIGNMMKQLWPGSSSWPMSMSCQSPLLIGISSWSFCIHLPEGMVDCSFGFQYSVQLGTTGIFGMPPACSKEGHALTLCNLHSLATHKPATKPVCFTTLSWGGGVHFKKITQSRYC